MTSIKNNRHKVERSNVSKPAEVSEAIKVFIIAQIMRMSRATGWWTTVMQIIIIITAMAVMSAMIVMIGYKLYLIIIYHK